MRKGCKRWKKVGKDREWGEKVWKKWSKVGKDEGKIF